ncbi:MAG: DUF1573 domain-containing protein [Bacteroidales bacterium]|nr:DUF1573 domain-containing protein [Bacteroidales bacterium]
MKRLFALVFVISVVLTTGCAQQTSSNEVNKFADGPKIDFNKTEHDFGNIEYQGNGITEFVFKNTGGAPLILSNVRASCGCTTPEWPRNGIKPGDESVIKVKYDTKRVGSFSKTITVYSNADKSPIVLKIKGVVGPKPQPAEAAAH